MLKYLLSLTGQDFVILIYSNHTNSAVPLNLFSCLTKAQQKSPSEINSFQCQCLSSKIWISVNRPGNLQNKQEVFWKILLRSTCHWVRKECYCKSPLAKFSKTQFRNQAFFIAVLATLSNSFTKVGASITCQQQLYF